MLLDDVLAELEEAGVPSKETRFVSPPTSGPYAFWDDAIEAGGADCANTLRTHTALVTVVEHPDDETDARAALEAALDARAQPWSREMRSWVDDLKVYTTDYSFTFYEKMRR